MSEIAFVVLGWVLGIFQPVLVEGQKKRRRLQELNTSILAELDELRYRLAYLSFKLAARLRQADREFFEWFLATTKDYSGRYRESKLDEGIEGLTELSNENLQVLLEPYQIPGRGIGFKHFRVAAMDATIHEIGGFPESYQRALFDFQRLLDALNEEIDEAMNYHHKTFEPGHSEFQEKAIQGNFEVACESILKDCTWLIETINKLDEFKEVNFGSPNWLRSAGKFFQRTVAETTGPRPGGDKEETGPPGQ